MSAFKVGDRVRNKVGNWLGTVTAVGPRGAGTILVHEDGTFGYIGYHAEYFDIMFTAPALAVAPFAVSDRLHQSGARVMAGGITVVPTLETATGDDLDKLARDRFGATRDDNETDRDFRDRCLNYIDAPDPYVTHAEWAAVLAQINDQAKALDTVRKFLGEASFASCSLADQRRAREVMGVVLAAIDKARAGK